MLVEMTRRRRIISRAPFHRASRRVNGVNPLRCHVLCFDGSGASSARTLNSLAVIVDFQDHSAVLGIEALRIVPLAPFLPAGCSWRVSTRTDRRSRTRRYRIRCHGRRRANNLHRFLRGRRRGRIAISANTGGVEPKPSELDDDVRRFGCVRPTVLGCAGRGRCRHEDEACCDGGTYPGLRHRQRPRPIVATSFLDL